MDKPLERVFHTSCASSKRMRVRKCDKALEKKAREKKEKECAREHEWKKCEVCYRRLAPLSTLIHTGNGRTGERGAENYRRALNSKQVEHFQMPRTSQGPCASQ